MFEKVFLRTRVRKLRDDVALSLFMFCLCISTLGLAWELDSEARLSLLGCCLLIVIVGFFAGIQRGKVILAQGSTRGDNDDSPERQRWTVSARELIFSALFIVSYLMITEVMEKHLRIEIQKPLVVVFMYIVVPFIGGNLTGQFFYLKNRIPTVSLDTKPTEQ